jgi:hypothetical protein
MTFYFGRDSCNRTDDSPSIALQKGTAADAAKRGLLLLGGHPRR